MIKATYNFLTTCLIYMCLLAHANAQKKPEVSNFEIANPKAAVPVFVAEEEAKVVHLAAGMFANDVADISGQLPEIIHVVPNTKQQLIIAGTIGKSEWIEKLAADKKIDTSALIGKWESWTIKVVNHPFSGVNRALVIVGSDRRATAYGILELSRMMGVSPWKWWADATPRKQAKIKLNIREKTYGSPSVKYRGLFINDEDWGLQPWAAKTFEPETGDIGPKTYAKIFELMLRLRANTLWPAMHDCTKAFYTIPGNAQMADDYAIVVGTSHCEPMLCNINVEWNSQAMGEWRYDVNANTIRSVFEDRAKQTSAFESIYTIGMRGKHDSPMDAKNLTKNDRIRLLEHVIADQRSILGNEKETDAAAVPQVFIPYKEVLDYYQNGLEVPEDVTLMWTDDNYGYIRQLSTPEEQKRPGGAGIYYHASYWGRPHDYLWLSSANPMLIWEEMYKAYQLNARNMWVLNCGDIKPLEYNIELFMDMAWDMDAFMGTLDVQNHLKEWTGQLFGVENQDKLTHLLLDYYRLCFIRRPEFMAWSQTEPVTKPKETGLTQIRYGDELSERLRDWEKLSREVEKLKEKIPANHQDAFYEMVYYPVSGASLMNQKWLFHYKNKWAAQQGRNSAKEYARRSAKAYEQIETETEYFNTELVNGKWKHIMDMAPRNLPVFSEPSFSLPAKQKNTGLGLALEGYEMEVNKDIPNAHSDVLPVLNSFLKDSVYVDVFLKGEGEINWKAVPKADWINLSVTSGKITTQQAEKRLWVNIDWNKVPKAKDTREPPLGHDYQLIPPSFKVNSSIDFVTEDTTISIGVSVFNPDIQKLDGFNGFVEGNGYVSINAENFTKAKAGEDASWEIFRGLGYSGNVVSALPYNAKSLNDLSEIKNQSPVLEYDFYTFNSGAAEVRVQAIPTHSFYEGRNVRCAVAIDENEPVIIDFKTVGRSEEWKQNVLKNAAVKSAQQEIDNAGRHKLKIWMVDPGVMLDQILIDLGGWKGSYAFPKETKCKN